MKKTLRLLVLSTALGMTALPMFAEGPGSGDPPPPGGGTPTAATTNGSSTASTIAILLTYLGL